MMIRVAAAIIVGACIGVAGLPALAHTSLASTLPKSGSVLEQSPPVIEIKFRDTASLTSVVLVDPAKAERKLEFAPIGAATSFKIKDPRLAAGRNEIRWKALSLDGHVISGSLILTINPPAKTH